jgi:seryl-tRNA synthetase
LHANEVTPENELPIQYGGLSHCFRTEAGAYGRHSKGLYRVHQFTKLEMFVFTAPEASEKWHEKIVQIEEEIFKGLEIPIRVVEI